jgi:hypothetical protein
MTYRVLLSNDVEDISIEEPEKVGTCQFAPGSDQYAHDPLTSVTRARPAQRSA